jgi:hypothetical protein
LSNKYLVMLFKDEAAVEEYRQGREYLGIYG